MPSAKLLDESHLFALTGGDAGLRDEILETFLESARGNIELLRAADSGDIWRRAAHRLKGLAASVGAQSMADLAAEATLGNPDPALIAQLDGQLGILAQMIHDA